MKKIVTETYMFADSYHLDIFDPTDYIRIKKDGERIDDKYVDRNGDIIGKNNTIKKNGIIIKWYYRIGYSSSYFYITLPNKISYFYFPPYQTKIERSLKTKNSTIDFDRMKKGVILMFSSRILINK